MQPIAARVVIAIALPVLEYLGLSVIYDGGDLASRPSWWSGLGNVGELVRIAAAVGTAALVLEGGTLRLQLRDAASALRPPSLRWALLHVASVALFFQLTGLIFERAPVERAAGLLSLGAWLACGAFLVYSALRCMLGATLGGVLAGAIKALGLGLGLGLFAWYVALQSLGLWDAMAQATLQLSAAWLGLFSRGVWMDAREYSLGLPGFSARIAYTCTGIEGLGMMAVFCGAYLYRARDRLRFPRALALLPIALAAVWLTNTLRIALLVAIGAYVSPELAFGAFHSKAGWLFFCGLALVVVVVAERSPYFTRAPAPATSTDNPTAAYCMPFLSLLGLGLWTSTFATALDLYYGVRIAGALACLYWFRREYALGISRVAPGWVPIATGLLAFAIWMALAPAADAAYNARFAQQHAALSPIARGAWDVLRVLGAVVVVPLAEELAFRGYLQRRLIATDFTSVAQGRFEWLSLCATSLAFGVLHDQWIAGTAVGLVYALTVYRSGRLLDAIVAHATTNAALATWVLARGRWDLW